MTQKLLSVRDLSVIYHGENRDSVAINGLNFEVGAGETLAIVGESGCGKSTTALAIMGILPGNASCGGEICFNGQDIAKMPKRQLNAIRGKDIGMIFQDPMAALNPVYSIGYQIIEVLQQHERMSRRQARERAIELLELVDIPDPHRRVDALPHQMSGGQRQRAVIAMAVACDPKLLIADEATTALDATVQHQILDLIRSLGQKLQMGVIMISHDLSLVARWADRVLVMHHGEEMEKVPAKSLFTGGRHPYTTGLISSSIRLEDGRHYSSERLPEIVVKRSAQGEYSFKSGIVSQVALPVRPRESGPLVSVRDVTVDYHSARGTVRAVDGVTFDIGKCETLGLVGETGSGKSTVSKALMRLVNVSGGQITFDGHDITHIRGPKLRSCRRNFQMVFQDPYSSLNPRHSVGDILGSVLATHGVSSSAERRKRVAFCINQVGLPRNAAERYPHEFSGGQRQRVAIARAIILKPKLIVCDEAVSALDLSVQAQILNLLDDLKSEFGLSYLFVSHDLAVVRYVSDRVMIMDKGKIVEMNDHESIWRNPQHEYTRALIRNSA